MRTRSRKSRPAVIVVLLIPTTLSLRTLDQLTEFIASFDGRRPNLLGFFCMVDQRKHLHATSSSVYPPSDPTSPPPPSRRC
jgi:pyruvate-formate lyase-activating enzyme